MLKAFIEAKPEEWSADIGRWARREDRTIGGSSRLRLWAAYRLEKGEGKLQGNINLPVLFENQRTGKVSLVHVRLRQRLFLEHVLSRVSWLDRTSLRIMMGVRSESLRHNGSFANRNFNRLDHRQQSERPTRWWASHETRRSEGAVESDGPHRLGPAPYRTSSRRETLAVVTLQGTGRAEPGFGLLGIRLPEVKPDAAVLFKNGL